jgi:hypothetical protein
VKNEKIGGAGRVVSEREYILGAVAAWRQQAVDLCSHSRLAGCKTRRDRNVFALDGEVRMRHKKLEDLAIIIAAGLLFWAILFFVALPALDQEDAARAKRVTEITKGAGK